MPVERIWRNLDQWDAKEIDGKPVTWLWAEQPMLIVPCDSGEIIATQASGMACSHPYVEGVVVPLDAWDTDFLDTRLDCVGCCYGPITYGEVQAIEAAFAEAGLPLSVDMDNIASSTEAWLYVRVAETATGALAPYAGKGAILTWENCD